MLGLGGGSVLGVWDPRFHVLMPVAPAPAMIPIESFFWGFRYSKSFD